MYSGNSTGRAVLKEPHDEHVRESGSRVGHSTAEGSGERRIVGDEPR